MKEETLLKIYVSLIGCLGLLLPLLAFNITYLLNYKSISSIDNYSQNYYSENYRGFNILSNENNFTKIEEALDKLNVVKSDYENLFLIKYLIYSNSCDGGYYQGDYIILYKCNEDLNIRNYHIDKEDSEAFILAHELGHYSFYNYYNYNVRQYLSDDYAYKLLKGGEDEKIKRR